MSAPQYSAEDFLSALLNLMPRGAVWPRDPDSTVSKTLGTLAPTWARHTQRNNYLIQDAFPSATVELLHEWEQTLGLPDPCAGISPTLQGRQAQVLARLTANGGQSIQYFTDYAAALGYTITISEYSPFRVGQHRMGTPINGPDWAHAWSVRSAINTVTQFRIGSSGMGEPLQSWGNDVLQCVINEIKPAHTALNFIYS